MGRIGARSCTRVIHHLARQEAAAVACRFTRFYNRQQERQTVLSQQLERFLRISIRSVWEVELLLLLRQEPSRSWSTAELIRQLRASGLVVNDALVALQRVELVTVEPAERFRYRPANAELAVVVDELAAAYASLPSSIMHVIWSTPRSNIEIFADAFRFRKDKNDGT